MKAFIFVLFLMGLLCSIQSCKKTNYSSLSGGTSLTIVNAVVGSSNLVTDFTGSAGSKAPDSIIYLNALSIPYGSYSELGSYSGTTFLSVSPITDTLLSLWRGQFHLTNNAIHTLFLVGPDSLHIDTLLTTDVLPVHVDSSVGVRFVNVSPGSNPVSVDIQGRVNGSEVASLAYKGVSPFINYPATASVSSYVFEFTDVASGTLLATYTMNGVNAGTGSDSTSQNMLRWKNVTIALQGLPGGAGNNAQATFLINDY